MPAPMTTRPTSDGDDWDQLLAEWNDADPFVNPTERRDNAAKAGGAKKTSQTDRKPTSPAPDGLGVEKELDLKKKPRAPRVKLDEARLLSADGIPKLRRKAQSLKLKGKGHEITDAARLLSFYQLWLDDLFPKAKFLDALAMVEVAGHKTSMQKQRITWIDESTPKPSLKDDEMNALSARAVPARDVVRKNTPDDLLGDDDFFDATPRRAAGPAGHMLDNDDNDNDNKDENDNNDMELLVALEGLVAPNTQHTNADAAADRLFGVPLIGGTMPSPHPVEYNLDALMAEAEAATSNYKPKAHLGHILLPDIDSFTVDGEAIATIDRF